MRPYFFLAAKPSATENRYLRYVLRVDWLKLSKLENWFHRACFLAADADLSRRPCPVGLQVLGTGVQVRYGSKKCFCLLEAIELLHCFKMGRISPSIVFLLGGFFYFLNDSYSSINP
jgi:hypothetical protein